MKSNSRQKKLEIGKAALKYSEKQAVNENANVKRKKEKRKKERKKKGRNRKERKKQRRKKTQKDKN